MDTLLDKWQALLDALQTTFSQAPNVLTMDWNALHFLRPEWFYGFIPLTLLLLVLLKKFQNNKSWQKVCDAQLLPHILTTKKGKKSYLPVFLIFIAGNLCLTALAGPVIKKLPQPVFREQSALVVLLDLSQSMDAQDIKPSRIERAKLELLDILAKRRGGQSALIVYAADAFTVTPLTDDNATIANLVPSLETSMMPAQGSRLDIALKKAQDLFTQSGLTFGDILLITDDIHQQYNQSIKKISASGFRVSIFAIGSAQGGPIPLSNGFLKDKSGAIVIPKLDAQKLQKMALSGHGLYVNIDAGEQDTLSLTNLFQSSLLNKNADNQANNGSKSETDIHADVWQEEGIWLLFPLIFFAALWARKGWLVLVVVLTVLSDTPPAYADETIGHTKTEHTDSISVLNNLWLTPNQKGMQAFENGDNKKAADQFNRTDWKASALYRNGDFEQAAELFASDTKQNTSALSTSDHLYNKANALAKAGKYKEAITAYEKAIELNADNDDAIYNKKLVKDALKKQQEQQKEQDKKDQKKKDPSDKKDGEKSDEDKEKQDQQDGDKSEEKEGKDGEDQDSEKNNSDQQGKQKSDKNKDQQQDKEQDQQSSADEKEPDDKQKKSPDANKQNEQQKKQQDNALKQRNPDDQDSKDKQKEQEKLKQDESNSEKDLEHKDDEKNEQKEKDQSSQVQEINPREASVSEDEHAIEQWLRRVQDDPGGLLRRKFLYQYKNVPNQKDSDQPW